LLTTLFSSGCCLFIGVEGHGIDEPLVAPTHSAVAPVDRYGWWGKRHEAVKARVKEGKVDLIMIGDSITHGWESEGKEIWEKTDFGRMTTRMGFGEGSSPTIHGGVVLVPWDHEGPSCLIALDKTTGTTIWKADREDEPSCWATPLVVEHEGAKQVVVSGQTYARGYDFSSGKELWRCGGQTQRPVASPVAGHGLVFIGSGFRGSGQSGGAAGRRKSRTGAVCCLSGPGAL